MGWGGMGWNGDEDGNGSGMGMEWEWDLGMRHPGCFALWASGERVKMLQQTLPLWLQNTTGQGRALWIPGELGVPHVPTHNGMGMQ